MKFNCLFWARYCAAENDTWYRPSEKPCSFLLNGFSAKVLVMSNQNSEIQADEGADVLQLPEKCSGEALETLKDALLPYLELTQQNQVKPILLDGRQVNSIDILGLQLLVWFQLRIAHQGLQYSLYSSNKMISSARVFGLKAHFFGEPESKVS